MLGVPIIATIYHSIKNSWLQNNLEFTLPFNFKVLYAASILYALGILIYQLTCPKIIKQNDSVEYIAAYQEFMSAHIQTRSLILF